MTWVKFCGVTRRADVEAAVKVGADAVGFVTDPGSSRAVTPRVAGLLGAGISVARFLVTVDLDPDALLDQAAVAGVDGVQPHGRSAVASARAAGDAGYRVLFPVPVVDGVDLEGVPEGAIPLLDAAVAGRHGGTGRTFDWGLAEHVAGDFVLAGGLSPDNVAEAVRRLDPWGLDVSSGIEQAPGIKSEERMLEFLEAAR